MRKHSALFATAIVAFGGGLFAALSTTGPCEVVRNWPTPLSQLPGHDHGARPEMTVGKPPVPRS